MEKLIKKLKSRGLALALRIKSGVLKSIHDYTFVAGAILLVPVIIFPLTGPIFHLADKSCIVPPKIGLEKTELLASEKYLADISPADIEFKGKGGEYFMAFIEDISRFTVRKILEECGAELETLHRELRTPKKPLKTYDSQEAMGEYGRDYEQLLSSEALEPFWVINIKREFYDREDPMCPVRYLNCDLVYLEGFGEALSGGERAWTYDVLVRKIRDRGQSPDSFAPYIELAKRGELRPLAGGGLGVERLVRYLSA